MARSRAVTDLQARQILAVEVGGKRIEGEKVLIAKRLLVTASQAGDEAHLVFHEIGEMSCASRGTEATTKKKTVIGRPPQPDSPKSFGPRVSAWTGKILWLPPIRHAARRRLPG